MRQRVLLILIIFSLLTVVSPLTFSMDSSVSPRHDQSGPQQEGEMAQLELSEWGLSFSYPAAWTVLYEAGFVRVSDLTQSDQDDPAVFTMWSQGQASTQTLLDTLRSLRLGDLCTAPSEPRSIAGQQGEGAVFTWVDDSNGLDMAGYCALFGDNDRQFAVMTYAAADQWVTRWETLDTIIDSISSQSVTPVVSPGPDLTDISLPEVSPVNLTETAIVADLIAAMTATAQDPAVMGTAIVLTFIAEMTDQATPDGDDIDTPTRTLTPTPSATPDLVSLVDAVANDIYATLAAEIVAAEMTITLTPVVTPSNPHRYSDTRAELLLQR